MNIRTSLTLIVVLSFFLSCVSIPKESITLSQTLGKDLQILHKSHRNMVDIHFKKIKDDINSFVDDTYAPYVIHYVLNKQLEAYEKGDSTSIYAVIHKAGEVKGKEQSEIALEKMESFLNAARNNIESKRKNLLEPIEKQQSKILKTVDDSYEHAIYANSTITGHLQSIRKVKEAQQEALSLIGLEGADSVITNSLVNISEKVSEATEKAKEIDVKSEDALEKLEEISKKIKEITDKK